MMTESPEIYRSTTIREIVITAQAEPLNRDDEKTIQGREVNDVGLFVGFSDFDLDLSCLSPPPSPVASTSGSILPSTTPSPPPSPLLLRSISFSSNNGSRPSKKSFKRPSSPQLLSATSNRVPPGSWPLVRYAGRGTPIDRNRRIEWGGFVGEVGEDGVLASSVRSTSMDSATRPSQRSSSSEWNYLSSPGQPTSILGHRPRISLDDPIPALAPIKFKSEGLDDSNEWDSIMQTILRPTESPPPPEILPVIEEAKILEEPPKPEPLPPIDLSSIPPERLEQLNTRLNIDCLDNALDLGLGQRGGMNWYNLGFLPPSGRGTPSIYSTASTGTPRASPPLSVHASEENRSTTSTKTEVNIGLEPKTELKTWWQKAVMKIRRLPRALQHHRSKL